ncbi:MAG: urate hydroxylase PuuD [Luteolibacter sp.]
MESEIAGWFSVVLRFVHVIAAIMWIGNSILFTWMELNLIPPAAAKPDKDGNVPENPLLGHLDMLHGGGVFHLEKRTIDPKAIPVPLHWFMWQSYTTFLSGILLLISVFYIHGGSALMDATKSSLTGFAPIALSLGGIIGGWLIYDGIWRTKLKEHKAIAVPLSLALILAAAYFYNQFFNGRAVYIQIGVMMGSFMTANVFIHIISNQKKFMASLLAGKPHDLKYGKQAKLRSMHNHYITFPVLFLMLSGHFPQLSSAERNIPILGVLIVSLVAVKFLMNSRYYFRQWLIAIFGTFIAACCLIALLLSTPTQAATAGANADPAATEGAKLFLSQGCAACHQSGSSQIAPNLQGLLGATQVMADDTTRIADEAYIRRSIQEPAAEIVKGYPPAMPPFAHLTDEQLDALVAYIKSLK